MLFVGLAGATIFISWMVMQVAFALHYAHQYYRPNHSVPGINSLDFPKDVRPYYWDFTYFSMLIGAASHTSDVNIETKGVTAARNRARHCRVFLLMSPLWR